MAKYEELKDGAIFPAGSLNEVAGQYFIGDSYLNMLALDPDIPVNVGSVTFEPGCRNNWHIHRGGFQILLVTGGEGWYQEEGQEPRILRQGDVVIIKDGVKHWHGAAEDSWFVHLAITAGTTEWQEPVDDQQYKALSGEK